MNNKQTLCCNTTVASADATDNNDNKITMTMSNAQVIPVEYILSSRLSVGRQQPTDGISKCYICRAGRARDIHITTLAYIPAHLISFEPEPTGFILTLVCNKCKKEMST